MPPFLACLCGFCCSLDLDIATLPHAPRVYSLEVEKRGLSAYDNKRYLLADGVHTLAFGHRDIPAGAVEIDENVPIFDDEHIDARLAVDREMPPPAQTPPPPPLPTTRSTTCCMPRARRIGPCRRSRA